MGTIVMYVSGCLCLLLLSVIFKFINRLWWTPIRIQSKMRAQGIRGPTYKFVYGNAKEIVSMRNEIMSSPMELSHDIFPRINSHIYSWIKQYGSNFLMWHGTQPQLVVTEPELIKEILNDKDKTYSKKKAIGYTQKLLGDGLASVISRVKWFKQRKIANHAFHAESLKNMVPAMIASVGMMMERWREYEGKEFEVFQECKLLTSEIISRTAFGSSYLEGENIFNLLTKMISIVARNQYTIKIPGLDKLVKTPDDVESDKLQQSIRDCIGKMIKEREDAMISGETESYGSDFLGALIKAYRSTDETQKISFQDVIDECKTYYIAGHETTSSLLTWVIFLLAFHTDWQEKVRREVLDSFGQHDPTPDGLSRLKIISMVINEALRLYSPAVTLLRTVKQEVKMGKLILPANMELYIPIFALHNDPKIWGEDAYRFNPERFAQGVAKATNNNVAAFVPFGFGPRFCIGNNFSISQTKIALSMILQRYRFALSPNYVHSPYQVLTIRPQHGLQVMLHAL